MTPVWTFGGNLETRPTLKNQLEKQTMKDRIMTSLTPALIGRYVRNAASPRATLARRLNVPLSLRRIHWKQGRQTQDGYSRYNNMAEVYLGESPDGGLLMEVEEGFDVTEPHSGWRYCPHDELAMMGGAIELHEFRNIFFEAVQDTENDAMVVHLSHYKIVDFSGVNCLQHYDVTAGVEGARGDTARVVSLAADSRAEDEANVEREHQVARAAEIRIEELRKDRAELRDEFREGYQAFREDHLCSEGVRKMFLRSLRHIREQRQALLDQIMMLKVAPESVFD